MMVCQGHQADLVHSARRVCRVVTDRGVRKENRPTRRQFPAHPVYQDRKVTPDCRDFRVKKVKRDFRVHLDSPVNLEPEETKANLACQDYPDEPEKTVYQDSPEKKVPRE